MKACLFTFLLILSIEVFSQQTDWFWKNPLPQGNNLNSIQVVNSNVVVAVGDCGVILRTTNSGNDWNLFHYNDTSRFNSVFFINDQTGWITGGSYAEGPFCNVILRTTNGGMDWQQQQTNLNDALLNAIFFVNPLTGYAGGGNFSAGKFLKTIDGGLNWVEQIVPFDKEIGAIYFMNQDTGWIGLIGNIAKTTNGGVSWNIVTGIPGIYRSIKFLNSQHGFAGTLTKAYESTNGGISWNVLTISSPSVCFVNQLTGWLGASYIPTRIYKTTNAGVNWNAYNCETIEHVNSITFVNEETGWGVGWYGTLQKTINGGVNWTNELGGFEVWAFQDASFPNDNTGFVIGGLESTSKIFKTIDQGENWNQLFLFPMLVKAVDFPEPTTGWICSGYQGTNLPGKVWKTIDAGNNWVEQVNTNEVYVDIKFIDVNTGYVFGYNTTTFRGKIMKTTNSGMNWSYDYLGDMTAINEASFIDVNTGYICCMSGKIFRTTNSGSNWSSVPFGINTGLICINFKDYNTGWIGTDFGGVYRTSDAGNSWNLEFETSYGISDLEFVNDQTGWASSFDGVMAYTTNGGANWQQYPRLTYNGIAKIAILTNNIGLIFGGKGMILKTTNGGGIIGILPNSQFLPSSFHLYQNYPNPFNPVTNIKFEIPKSGFVQITIYDLLGREITRLVNQQMQPGSYSVDWDASNYTSGVYFYSLVVGDPSTGSGRGFAGTKKMVLIK